MISPCWRSTACWRNCWKVTIFFIPGHSLLRRCKQRVRGYYRPAVDIPTCVTIGIFGMKMSFTGQVNGHASCVVLDSGASESFMSIACADQLRLSWSTEEAVISIGKIGVAQGVCRIGICISSCTTHHHSASQIVCWVRLGLKGWLVERPEV